MSFVDETHTALYRVKVTDGPGPAAALEKLDEPAALSVYEAGAAAARAVALSAEMEQCSRTYNMVVLPADGTAGHWQNGIRNPLRQEKETSWKDF